MPGEYINKIGWRMPKFWYRNSPLTSILPELLLPVAVIYHLVDTIRKRRITAEKLNIPVVCVGNLTAGGAGKTPVAIEVAKLLLAMGKKVMFVSRGYGGRLIGPAKVEASHTAYEVGDEPLLLAKIAPCWVGRNKLATAKSAIADGAEILVLDDGLQNPYFEKDFNIAVVDGGFGLGNGFTIPAGPLRQPIPQAMKKTDAVIIIGEDVQKVTPRLLPYTRKIIAGRMVPDAAKLAELKTGGKKFIAFAGIGLPEKFFAMLKDNGVETIDNLAFPDHHNYDEEEITALINQAEVRGAALVTTEKDAVRIPAGLLARIAILPISVQFEGEVVKELLSNIAK